MSKILSRCQKALESQMIDFQVSIQKHKSLMRKTFGVSSTVGVMAGLTTYAFAASPNLSSFGSQIGNSINSIFKTAYGVITAAAALALLIAFAVRFISISRTLLHCSVFVLSVRLFGANCVSWGKRS